MSDKVTPFNAKAREPNPALITHLQELQKLADAGEIRSLCYVVGWDNGAVDQGMCPDPRDDVEKVIGGLATLMCSYAVQNALARPESGLLALLEQYFVRL